MDYDMFFQELKAGEFRRLYLFEGEEEYTKESALKALREKVVAQDLAALNENQLADPKPEEIIAACETLPAFAPRRLVIVKDYSPLARASKAEAGGEEVAEKPGKGRARDSSLEDYLDRLPDYICLVFYVRGQAGGARKLMKKIKDQGGWVSFDKLDRGKLVKWIARELKEYGKQIDRATAEQLLFACGDEMLSLKNELGKLAAHAGEREAVTVMDVEAAVTKSAEYRIFDLADRVAGGKAGEALRLLQEMMAAGERSLMLMSLLQRQYRQLLFAKIMAEEGQGPAAIAQRLGLPPFVARRMAEMVRGQTTAMLKEGYMMCVNQEFLIKSGQMSEEGSLEGLIMNLLVLRREEEFDSAEAKP
ncbi:MAG: DNA polymerase III subunit delta [Eubacteriales bacterium]|nr:DNA polymerase III subunit delta [Eubacteriales bacterium]